MDRYKAYKDSGVEWIGEIPVGWETSVFSHVCSASLGKMLTKEPKTDVSFAAPYLKAANLQENGFALANLQNMYFEPDEAEQYRLDKGDLLVVEGGSVGLAHVWDSSIENCYIQNALHRVRPREGFSSYYLKYCLDIARNSGYIDLVCNKATIAHFTKEKLLATPLAVPSLEEQQAIADFLDTKTAEIDGLVADCEREVELLQEYRKAAISEAVTKGLDPNAPMKDSGVEWIGEIPEGWAATSLQRIGVTIEQGWSPSPARDWVDGCWGVLSLSAIKNGHFLPNEVKPVSIEEKIPLGLKLQNGDLLVTRSNTRELVGDACLVNHVDDRTVFSDLIYRLTLSASTIDSKFALYALLSVSTRVQFAANAKGSSGTMPKINHRIIKQLRICLPPLIDQRAIVAYLDAKTAEIDSLIDSKRQMIEKLREYRKSLISEAVTGKFKVPGV